MKNLMVLIFCVTIIFSQAVYAEVQDCSSTVQTQEYSEQNEGSASNPCDENIDLHERWDQLQKEKQDRANNPEDLAEHCNRCNAECLEDGKIDPLRKWKCTQCRNECLKINSENHEE